MAPNPLLFWRSLASVNLPVWVRSCVLAGDSLICHALPAQFAVQAECDPLCPLPLLFLSFRAGPWRPVAFLCHGEGVVPDVLVLHPSCGNRSVRASHLPLVQLFVAVRGPSCVFRQHLSALML